jgi:hypothetical protein
LLILAAYEKVLFWKFETVPKERNVALCDPSCQSMASTILTNDRSQEENDPTEPKVQFYKKLKIQADSPEVPL